MNSPSQPNPAQVFEDYFGPAIFRPWGAVLIGLASPGLGDKVLDLACGTGTVARLVAEARGDSVELHGLDASPQMLDIARTTAAQTGLNIRWTEGSSENLPFEDGTFDLVLCQQGLQFFRDRERSAKEIYRILKAGGRLGASVWQDVRSHPLYGALFEAVSNKLEAPFSAVSLPFSMGEQDEVRSYIASGGFEKIAMSEQRLNVKFPTPQLFVQLSVAAAAAAIPAFAEMAAQDRAALAEEIAESLGPQVNKYVVGDFLEMPTVVNVAIASK